MDWRIGDDNRGWCVAMASIRNWRPRQKCRNRKMRPRFRQRQQMHQLRNQKIQRIWVNVSNSRGAGVFTGSGYARRLSNVNKGVVRRWRIRDKSKVLKTTSDAVGDRRRSKGIYKDNRGVRGGKWTRRLQQQQRKCRRRIYDASKGLKTTKEAAADWRQARWIGKNSRVLIFLAIGLLTVTLSHIYLVAVSFWYCFHHITFCLFAAQNTISTAIMRKIFLYQVYTNLEYLPST